MSSNEATSSSHGINDDETIATAADKKVATLRIEGPDKSGIVSAFSLLLYGHGANIIDAEQHLHRSTSLRR